MNKDTEITSLSTANLVWLATALLHTENKEKESFQIKQIFNKVKSLGLPTASDSTIMMHISLHCVANSKAQPDTHRKLFRVISGWYRLFHPDDSFDESRKNGRTVPLAEELPDKYRHLIDWYHKEYSKKSMSFDKDIHDASNVVFAKIENKNITLPKDVIEVLHADDDDYVAFIIKSNDDIILKKAKMTLEV